MFSSWHPNSKADAIERIFQVCPPFLDFIWTPIPMDTSTTDATATTLAGNPKMEGDISTINQGLPSVERSSRGDDAALLVGFVRCTSVICPYLSVVGSLQMHLIRALRC